MYLSHRVEELTANYGDARRAIGEFVLREHAHLSDYTIMDIAAQTFSSKASVTRFAQALGFDGWRDFIRAFMAEERYEASRPAFVDPNIPFAADDSDDKIAESIGDLTIETIADTARLLNRNILAVAVRYLQRATRIWVIGLSPNCYLGSLFCRKLVAIGKPAQVIDSDEAGIVSRTLGPDDCVVVISYSGNNPSSGTLRHIPEIQARRAPIIAVTSEGDNYLRLNANCTLTISSHESLYSKISTMATEASIGYLLNVLFACLFARDYDRNLEFKIRGGSVLEASRRSRADATEDGQRD